MTAAIPSEFMCPITMVVMKDPVLGTDGYTYEKEAIQQWLRSNTQSPMTREPMRMDGCRPNRALRDAIERWQKEKEKEAPKKKKTSSTPSAPSFNEVKPPSITPMPNYGTTFESDHMYAIMIQTQETVEQIKRSSPSAPPVQQQTHQVQRSLTEEQKRKYAMAVCFLFSAIIILIFVVDRMQSNASST